MELSATTSRADLSAACERFTLHPYEPKAPDQDAIREVLIDQRTTDGAGHDFSRMWCTKSMDLFQERLFSDYDLCADLFQMIGKHSDDYPLLAAAIDRLAEDLAEEL